MRPGVVSGMAVVEVVVLLVVDGGQLKWKCNSVTVTSRKHPHSHGTILTPTDTSCRKCTGVVHYPDFWWISRYMRESMCCHLAMNSIGLETNESTGQGLQNNFLYRGTETRTSVRPPEDKNQKMYGRWSIRDTNG